MPQIVNKSYFNKQNILYIPLASEAPLPSAVTSTPNDGTYIDALCIEIEKTILVNALGLTTYNELQLAIADEFTNPLYASYDKLVNGDEYDGKIWLGLDNEDSLIANYIYQEFVTQTDIRLSATGAKKVNPENATTQTPRYLIAGACQNFIKQYQGEYLTTPFITDNFIDWYGCNSIEKSLYGYLMDKQADFTNWKSEYFKIYETKNSFGI